ncbi:MAG TPA: response regulator, partial [Bacillota bacterium]|nr:response regulator [Bacillota bacterium]
VKFTNQGKIVTSVEILKQSHRKVTLLFKITDTGVGIPQEKLKAIFDPFVQAEDSTTRKFGGTGLGTTISKELVTLMKGEIGVESKMAQGSTFWFRVVFEMTDPVSGQIVPKTSQLTIVDVPRKIQDAVVMLVEDYPTNREVVLAHLKHFGCQSVIAENGRVAVEKFQAQPVDIILMDLQMPEMDGLTATAAIRKLPKGDQIPIIAMTANAFESDIEECLANGMNDVITKPFRKDLFRSKLVYWLTQDLKKPHFSDKVLQTQSQPVVPEEECDQPFNLEKVIVEFDNDKTVVFDVLSNFRKNLIKQIDIIENALHENDVETIRRNAHSIKGGAANLGAERLAAAALELEMLAKKGELGKGTESFTKLVTEIRKFEQYLTFLQI